MLSWIQKRSGLSVRKKKYQHSRSDSSASDSSTCTTSSCESRSTIRTTVTAGTEWSDHEDDYSNSSKSSSAACRWDLKTRDLPSRTPSFSSFKTSDSLLSFECLGDEAIAVARTATITKCNALKTVRIIEKPALRKAKSVACVNGGNQHEIRPLPTPGTTPEGCRPRAVYQERLNSWEQAGPRDGLCPIGPFAPHPAHTCHYLHLPLPPVASAGLTAAE
ncbi:hypothetical protein CB0940_08170 [Cercospora beticola]|uniref:Uncharacterized protein n=1 Tax=Cercospora beticola TaxID=122368 RepID=A0A2G5HRE2_CERBT|nr:hypothetical protein CB0940_08170 [Cercospora beticola]PIA95105.1 hypothetical protein CB0940_08170 [Cercospora beticola]WPB04737.1 hypothetical protein RHO25_009384 [Cercospora beticola]CAK1364493.1 unnamed protein product [Cercospora beticola]